MRDKVGDVGRCSGKAGLYPKCSGEATEGLNQQSDSTGLPQKAPSVHHAGWTGRGQKWKQRGCQGSSSEASGMACWWLGLGQRRRLWLDESGPGEMLSEALPGR